MRMTIGLLCLLSITFSFGAEDYMYNEYLCSFPNSSKEDSILIQYNFDEEPIKLFGLNITICGRSAGFVGLHDIDEVQILESSISLIKRDLKVGNNIFDEFKFRLEFHQAVVNIDGGEDIMLRCIKRAPLIDQVM